MSIHVQEELFDLHAITQELKKLHNSGASVTFEGYVRDFDSGRERLDLLQLEHYPGMTEKALSAIAEQAGQRWSIFDCTIIHRVGALAPTEQIVFVGVASAHRAEAFAACEFMMDFLKTQAPFWKKERFVDGKCEWVSANEEDDLALNRWKT